MYNSMCMCVYNSICVCIICVCVYNMCLCMCVSLPLDGIILWIAEKLRLPPACSPHIGEMTVRGYRSLMS